MKLLDICCGRFGWSKAFAARGHKCVGIDLIQPLWIPENCTFVQANILDITEEWVREQGFDCGVASTPCEGFSVHGIKMFHKNPPYPELGIKLFRHAEKLLSKMPYVMENVSAAEKFLGRAVNKCGPFYLWGNSVPFLLPQGIKKDIQFKRGERDKIGRWGSQSWQRKKATAEVATIPIELASCVAEYMEKIKR